MIAVSFTIPSREVKNYNPLSTWIQRSWHLPWLNYLLANNQGIETEQWYNHPNDTYTVIFKFNIEPEKETFYRIKFSN